jgi:mRNA interferase MazF
LPVFFHISEGINFSLQLITSKLKKEGKYMYQRKNRKVFRGEIYYYDFGRTSGSIQSGLRPVVIVQTQSGNKYSPTVIVAPVTSSIKKTNLPFHVYLGLQYGLKKESMLLLEQLQTINKSDLGEYIGVVGGKTMLLVNDALRATLKLSKKNKERTADIRCLCSKCLGEYINSPRYFLRRLDPLATKREKCDKCNSYGWDYILIDKTEVSLRRDKNV